MFTGGLDLFGRKERERAKELQRLLEEEERQAREREDKLRELEEQQKTSLYRVGLEWPPIDRVAEGNALL